MAGSILLLYNGCMSDVILLGIAVAFFVVTTLYVRLCDHMIGPDDVATDVSTDVDHVSASEVSP